MRITKDHNCPVCNKPMFGDDDSPTDHCPQHGSYPNPDFDEERSARQREADIAYLIAQGALVVQDA